jgi:hypothetical protein
MQSCTNKVNVMHTWQSLLNKEKVSQDLKDGFLSYLFTHYSLLILGDHLLYLGLLHRRPQTKRGCNSSSLQPPSLSSGALCRLSFLQPLPGLTEVGTKEEGRGNTRVPSTGS